MRVHRASLHTYVRASMFVTLACIFARVMRVSASLRAWECMRMCERMKKKKKYVYLT